MKTLSKNIVKQTSRSADSFSISAQAASFFT
jgi:hypothetical protein